MTDVLEIECVDLVDEDENAGFIASEEFFKMRRKEEEFLTGFMVGLFYFQMTE
jgi:hypothetical protein